MRDLKRSFVKDETSHGLLELKEDCFDKILQYIEFSDYG